MTKILSASDVKAHFYKLIEGVKVGDEIVVTKNGKPTAVMLSNRELSSLRETLDVLGDPKMMRQLRASQKQTRQRRRRYSFEELFGEPLVARKALRPAR